MTTVELVLIGVIVILLLLWLHQISRTRRFRDRAETRQTNAFEMGARQARGDMHQILGTFASLDEYEQIMLLSTTSKQGSLDLLGIKSDEIHFIEFKKKGAVLQRPERMIQRLVEEKKVRYVIKDVDLPPGLEMSDRPGKSFPLPPS